MSQLVVLEVEDVAARGLEGFHRRLFKGTGVSRVLVTPWTTRDPHKRRRYESIIERYFKGVGADEVVFMGEDESNVEALFGGADLVYLPGGDPALLLEGLRARPDVVGLLKGFSSVIVGNSAGAIALAKKGYVVDRGITGYQGLGLVSLNVLVHYGWEKIAIPGEEVVLLPDNSYIAVYKE